MRQRLILVVEDDRDLARIMNMVLEDAGYEVVLASNGEAGVEQARRQRPALVILDWRLPGLNGTEVAARLHEQYGTAIPILLFTAEQHVAKKAAEIGADAWIAKPFSIDPLLGAVER